MKYYFTSLSLLLLSTFCSAQIYTLDFDANNTGYTSGPDGFGNDGASATDYYDISSTGFGGTYNGSTGNFFAAQDIDAVSGFTSATQEFEINGLNIAAMTNLTFTIDLAEDQDGSNEDWDASDQFIVEYRIDGGVFNTLIEIGSPSTNMEPRVVDCSNAALIGSFVTNDFASFAGPIAGTGNTLDIRITTTLGSGDEDIAFDNLVIDGDDNSGTPGITVTSPAGSTSETGTTTTFTAVLNTEPISSVVLDVTSADTGENTVSPAMLTFTTSDWDMPQTITVTGVDDALFDGNQTTAITVSSNNGMTSDMDYQNLMGSVNVINIDDEVLTNSDVRINEADIDQSGTDFAEFIELFGTPNLSLDGLVVVLFNGNGDVAYETYDLDGFSLDGNGFLLIGATGVTGASGLVPFTPEIEIKSTGLQNGADAIALYSGNASDFPNGTAVTNTNLIDALVYDTNDSDDAGLAVLYSDPTKFDVDEMIQVNEDEFGDSEGQTIQRGSWFVSAPTPRSMNALPVKLTRFAAKAKDNSNLISWITEVEINNDYFEVQRSTDGTNFETIGKVDGNGNASREIAYEFIDETPNTGLNYYRLKQVDLDGGFELSYTVKVENKSNKVKIYPTNIVNIINIEIEDTESANLTLVNNLGQIFKSTSLNSTFNTIDISELPSGIYYAKVESKTQLLVERIVKY